VAVALVIGTIEIGGLVGTTLYLSGSFWSWFENVDINVLRFVVFGMFAATWAIALVVWRLARIEERWSAHEDSGPAHWFSREGCDRRRRTRKNQRGQASM
jgi:high-affinity nickel-transport protein